MWMTFMSICSLRGVTIVKEKAPSFLPSRFQENKIFPRLLTAQKVACGSFSTFLMLHVVWCDCACLWAVPNTPWLPQKYGVSRARDF